MTVACIALAISLTSASYAAFVLPPKSVGTKHLKKKAVGTKHLKKNAVKGSKVRNNSLSGADIKESTLGTVPSAATATAAATADSAKTADTAGTATTAVTAESAKTADQATAAETAASATTATDAANAANADLLDNLNSSDFLRVGVLDAFHDGAVLPAAPSPLAGTPLTSLNVTLQRAARIFAMGRVIGTVSCAPSGPCAATYALFVDGVLVANSQTALSAATSATSGFTRIELRGLTGTLGAGAHTLTMRASSGTNVAGQSWGERTLSAIAVG